jgi:hypothetical protein
MANNFGIGGSPRPAASRTQRAAAVVFVRAGWRDPCEERDRALSAPPERSAIPGGQSCLVAVHVEVVDDQSSA